MDVIVLALRLAASVVGLLREVVAFVKALGKPEKEDR